MLVSGERAAITPESADDPTVDAFATFLADAGDSAAATCRDRLVAAKQQLENRFRSGEPVEKLVNAHAGLIDALLRYLWRQHGIDDGEVALVAVGGYGRGELHPGSDIDILLLLRDDAVDTDALSGFVTGLWDVGLEIGHSVRTVADCVASARADVTVATTLMEARLLRGPEALFDAMREATAKDQIWDSQSFFIAKREEQTARHHRYGDTGYNLEPNIKGSPGGLRDIQMIAWVAKRHFGSEDLSSLLDGAFLTEGQYQRLIEGRHYLWTLRYGLHVLTGRREDRLLFDHQKALALMLGYEDARYTLGVEQMMQRYYRTVMELSRLNEMLLQLFEEEILLGKDPAPTPLSDSFVSANNYLQVVDDDVFVRNPSALLELFLCMQEHPSLKGVSARTIGLLRRSLHVIDEQFRQHPRNHRLFMRILAAEHGVTRELRRMNRYGVLGEYIPAFGRIVGRMQYDLFHAYTVDEHTLFLISNLRRFALERFQDEFPHCSRVMARLDDPALAYLAGLFHDIAKGRGGDHSELGAVDALAFCREHGLAEADAQLVSWIVANHLVLSMTAQKKDISDPDVIAAFARRVTDQRHLDYLYVLTAADVRATDPKLWNSWKSKLFRDLYEATSRALERGPDHQPQRQPLIDETRGAARELLRTRFDAAAIDGLWQHLPDDYFLRHSASEIAWHSHTLLTEGSDRSQIAVIIRPELHGLAIMLYTPLTQHTFAAVTATLDSLGLSVLDARIEPIKNGFSLDTYIVVERDGEGISESRQAEVSRRLAFIRKPENDVPPQVTRQMPRRQRMFMTRTKIVFKPDDARQRTVMELTCADHPGLLRTVGRVLIDHDIYINTAKIVTIGERAEDVFYLTNTHEMPLDDAQIEALGNDLRERLGERGPQSAAKV